MENSVTSTSYAAKAASMFTGSLSGGACGVFEIKESSDALVRRMLDYIYTGKYEELSSEVPEEDSESSSSELDEPGPDPKVMLHAKMMEMGDIYLVDGLGLHANDRFNIRLKYQTTRNILVDIVPKVYAMEFKSCKLIRTTLIDCMRKILARRPLPADVEESWEDATRDVPEFTRDLVKSYKDMPVLGHCDSCGNTKTVPVSPLQLKCLLCNRGGASNLRTWD
ncbi:hypothetical protein E4U13_003735 [Claviceps humidiphila]|uniref:BTB domain-containing protein n=1 Tax=Claviceps humidiphila TaxID=1294629 RepID=A0A9P7Q2F0_9HYPO|nr:hypothetical protein E4U13_003735 [Claviceps humidiphila]